MFRWLFAESKHRQHLASSLASIAESATVDHRVKLGCCVVIRELVEKEAILYRVQVNEGLSELEPPMMSFTKCVHPLVDIICKESIKQGKHKLPTRLTMAAADCVIVITKSLVSDPPATPTQTPTEKQERDNERVLITPTLSSESDDTNASSSGLLHYYNLSTIHYCHQL